MNTISRALVIGASETAELLHLPVLASLRDKGRIELVEICDLRGERADAVRKRFDFARASGDAAAAMARSDFDAVYIFGGARMHHALGLAALEADKHLFVEKPVAPTYAEAMELADAACWRGLIAAGGHNRRFLAALERIRRDGGQAGWSFAEAVFHKPGHGKPAPFGAATWLGANGIHALDALVWMMGGLPESLAAQTGGLGSTPSVFTAMMRWPNGAQGALLCNNEAGTRCEEYRFHAPGESWRVSDSGLIVERDGVRSVVDLSPARNGFEAEHEAFLNALATGVPPRHSIGALAPSLFLAELIEASHCGPVRLPSASVKATAATPQRHTVVVVNADRLRSQLGAFPTNWTLLPLEELGRSLDSRPDIKAAILGDGARPLDDAVLDKVPNLEIVGVAGLSVKRVGADRLLDRGIAVVNASGAYAESVAEFALGLALLGRRRAFASHEAMRGGGWGTALPTTGTAALLLRSAPIMRSIFAKLGVEEALRRAWVANPKLAQLSRNGTPRSAELRGGIVGLIGWGANARAFTRRLVDAGASVIAHSEHASADEIRSAGAEAAPLANVLAADIVSLHRGLTPATRHCIGSAELARLRPGAVLINVARGALIDPDALVARLRRGDIFACLDTFEGEPLPRRHPLRKMPNVFLTSHIAGGSADMHANAIREVVGKVARHLDGDAVETVTAGQLATMT